jgi:hypothetical protein
MDALPSTTLTEKSRKRKTSLGYEAEASSSCPVYPGRRPSRKMPYDDVDTSSDGPLDYEAGSGVPPSDDLSMSPKKRMKTSGME